MQREIWPASQKERPILVENRIANSRKNWSKGGDVTKKPKKRQKRHGQKTPLQSFGERETLLAMFRKLSEAICHLALEIGALREQREKEFCWLKSTAEFATKSDLKQLERNIMATQAEVVVELKAAKEQVIKIKQEVVDAAQALKDTIKRLEDIIADGSAGTASPELVSIKDELKAELQMIDEINPDKPVEPPPVA